MIIYIAGPISGIPNRNRDAFAAARALVSQAEPSAFVIAPFDIFQAAPCAEGCSALEWAMAMVVCLSLIEIADRVVMLPGWESSRGARRERDYALERDIPIFSLALIPESKTPNMDTPRKAPNGSRKPADSGTDRQASGEGA